MSVANPFVEYLNRYTTASPDHEAAFDEFVAQSPPPAAGPLRLETKVASFLEVCFRRARPPSVILTGNAGDGKTYLCRSVVAAFTGQPAVDWDAIAERPLERDGVRLHVIKDLSELGAERGVMVLRGLAAALSGDGSDCYLIAANEGRLRDLLQRARQEDAAELPARSSMGALETTIDRQLQQRSIAEPVDPLVINLTDVSTSLFVQPALAWMTDAKHWASCASCPIADHCPVRHNAARLSEPQIAERVQFLYQLLEHLDTHVTVRDMLIHLAYTVTGSQRCHELQQQVADRADVWSYAYYANVLGRPDSIALMRKAIVFGHLGRLCIGEHSVFDIDEFIVNGAEQPEERDLHLRLFAPSVDLDGRRFEQDRIAYVEGGAERAGEEAGALLRWLPHCRRKLFFEWLGESRVNQLVAFRHLDRYLALLENPRPVHDEVRRLLVLGLNRAFSRLYLTDETTLYVTSQYLHSAEQSRPLVRLAIPASGIQVRAEQRDDRLLDRAWPQIIMIFAPPSELSLVSPGISFQPETWRLNLLLFEHLLRLAHGGTYDVLAKECELSVRHLKDQLLGSFARRSAADAVEFFVEEQRSYIRKTLRIDERDTIHIGG